MGLGKGSNTFLVSTHVVEQLLFSMFPLILTFDFHLMLGSFLIFCGPNGLFLGSEYSSKNGLGGLHMELSNFYFLCFLQF